MAVTTLASDERRYVVGSWARVVGALVACLLLVGVAVRAAGSISGERERQTLDSLLTCPLRASGILFAKWLGSITSVAWGWLWLAAVWFVGVVKGDLAPISLPLLFLAWFIYAAFLSILGLWFSLTCKTSLRAIMYTLFSTAAIGMSFMVLPFLWYSPMAYLRPGSWGEWLTRLQYGLAPPITLGWLLPIQVPTSVRTFQIKEGWELSFALLGLACWLAATIVFWILTQIYFRRLTVHRSPPLPGLSGTVP
jgi:ABC-type Na+ efflux pump permease subunit